MNKLDQLVNKLDHELFMFLVQDMGYEDTEANSLYKIKLKQFPMDNSTDVYIYIDGVSFDEFSEEVESNLNDIIQNYDRNSYFEGVEPGVYMARIWW